MKGKIALVTGAGSGIGKSAALIFAQRGCSVAVVDWNPEGGAQTVKEIEGAGGKALFLQTDVSDSAQVQEMVRKTVEHFGRLDCAFNNAGIAIGLEPLTEFAEEHWDRLIAVDLKGAWLCMKYEIAEMLKTGGGAIVNTASLAGLLGMPAHYGYVEAKHGVVGMTRSAALEYGDRGIRVNAVCPGMIETPMTDAFADEEALKALPALHPIGRIGKPHEVAEAAVWLCSDAASFVTGVPMPVDGGLLAGPTY
jgi:NAD(P)-dependent dehydrogenase (short-subunit alcohol dehydrogenase family)